MENWNSEGGSVFLIMFKIGHALPLPGGRFSCPRIGRGAGAERLRNMYCSWPQTRSVRELESSAHSPRKRIAHAYEQSVAALNPCQQSRTLTVRIRDGAMVSTVRGQALATDIKRPWTARALHFPCPQTHHESGLATNFNWQRMVRDKATSCPDHGLPSFPARI